MLTKLSEMKEGIIVPPADLELPICDHCNLTCSHCNHCSPALSPWMARPQQILDDLTCLAPIYRPKRVKILGGEPLLHKGLVEILQAVRESGISPWVFITTNGSLLHRLDPRVWDLVQEIEVSRYPGVLSESNLEKTRQTAQERGVRFTVVDYSHFRANFSRHQNLDSDLVFRIYRNCKVVFLWGCHMLKDGWFFKCPRAAYLLPLLGKEASLDGLRLEKTEDFQSRLLEYLNSATPLQACSHCAGTLGRLEPHHLGPRAAWKDLSLDRPVSELLEPGGLT
ncbi:4Fe-4S cluster-binding domain-containing protein [bacterium]|nr:4Fe-4S cluster-binding domain-containing protein [bacterium]